MWNNCKKYLFLTPIVSIVLLASCNFSKELPNSLEVGITYSDVKNMYPNTKMINFCNYVLFNEEERNIVIELDNSVVEHIEFIPITDFDIRQFYEINFETSVIDVIEKIGIPSFLGLENIPSLDFSNDENNIYRIYFKKKGDSFVTEEKMLLNKNDPSSWIDDNKTNLPSIEDVNNINLGMTIDEVIAVLGKPQRDVGSGTFLFEFDLINGKKLTATFIKKYKNETINEGKFLLYLVDYLIA